MAEKVELEELLSAASRSGGRLAGMWRCGTRGGEGREMPGYVSYYYLCEEMVPTCM